jgi:anaerobic selenocysteine-containing dehydrogenase
VGADDSVETQFLLLCRPSEAVQIDKSVFQNLADLFAHASNAAGVVIMVGRGMQSHSQA